MSSSTHRQIDLVSPVAIRKHELILRARWEIELDIKSSASQVGRIERVKLSWSARSTIFPEGLIDMLTDEVVS